MEGSLKMGRIIKNIVKKNLARGEHEEGRIRYKFAYKKWEQAHIWERDKRKCEHGLNIVYIVWKWHNKLIIMDSKIF